MNIIMPPINSYFSNDVTAASNSLRAMLQKEQMTYRANNYLANCTLPSALTESDRLKMVDWCYSIVDRFRFDREIVAFAMQVVDRFLSKPSTSIQDYLNDRQHFQLLALTSLYIAIKIMEPKAFGIDRVASMSYGMYSVDDIESMEMTILTSLEWQINGPTSIQLAYHILSVLLPHVKLEESTWSIILDEIRFQAEFAIRDYHLSTQRTSTVAMATIFNSLKDLDRELRKTILGALLKVLDERLFDSPREMLAAKNRLSSLVSSESSS